MNTRSSLLLTAYYDGQCGLCSAEMGAMHARDALGDWHGGVDAIALLYAAVGAPWLARASAHAPCHAAPVPSGGGASPHPQPPGPRSGGATGAAPFRQTPPAATRSALHARHCRLDSRTPRACGLPRLKSLPARRTV